MARVDVKVVLLGQQSVGKSCLVDRYINLSFQVTPKNTIGAAFAAKKVKLQSGRVLSLGIWDTAGAERFESLSRLYYNGAKAAILCFDPCDVQSFRKLKFWVGELRDSQPDCRIYIALTKCDRLEDPQCVESSPFDPQAEQPDSDGSNGAGSDRDGAGEADAAATSAPSRPHREVSDEEVAEYSKSLTVPRFGTPKVFITSARQGIGVYALFDTIAEDMSEAADAKLPEALGLHESTVRGQHEFKLPGGLASPQAVQATVLRSPAAPLPRKRPSGCCQ